MALGEWVIEPDRDPPKLLIIGPDHAANLLELVGDESNDDLWIWHAMKCRPDYLQLPGMGGQR
jgi:hypothetical protein